MNKIIYSPKAQQDMDDIWDYIAQELKNPSAAQHTVNRIMDDVERLEQHPFMGPSLSSISSLDSNFRFLVSGNYMAFYQVDGERIYISRVLYGRRNYFGLLFDESDEEGMGE